MALDFTKTTSNRLNLGTGSINPLVSGASKISIHAWVYADTLSSSDAYTNVALAAFVGSASHGIYLNVGGATAKVRVGGRSQVTDAFQQVSGATTVTTGAWHSVGGVLDISGDQIRVYLNGTQDAATGVTFGASTYTAGSATWSDAIGGDRGDATPTANYQWDGRIAEVSIFAYDIGTEGFAMLAEGMPAGSIPGAGPACYMPLFGVDSPERDEWGGLSGTIVGSLPGADHPPVFQFRGGGQVGTPTAASGITGSLSATQAGDTVSAAGKVLLSAATNPTSAGDTLTAASGLRVTASTAASQAGDTLAATGTLTATGLTGSASLTQAGDTLVAAGTVRVSSALAATQSSDTVSTAGSLTLKGELSVTATGDTLTSTGVYGTFTAGASALTQDGNTVSATGNLPIRGGVSVTVSGDTLSAASTLRLNATLATTGTADTVTATGISGSGRSATLAATQAGDTLSATSILTLVTKSFTVTSIALPSFTITPFEPLAPYATTALTPSYTLAPWRVL